MISASCACSGDLDRLVHFRSLRRTAAASNEISLRKAGATQNFCVASTVQRRLNHSLRLQFRSFLPAAVHQPRKPAFKAFVGPGGGTVRTISKTRLRDVGVLTLDTPYGPVTA
jgi:hypothetical protein